MLAVFEKSVAKCPEGLKNAESKGIDALKDDVLLHHFSSVYPAGTVSINLGGSGIIAFSSQKQNPLLPRIFGVVDDIFCLFQGTIENIATLKHLYGLTKTANEASIILEAYRAVRDRGSIPADHALRSIEGKFAFIIFDASTRTTFISVDADGGVPLFWGLDSEDRLVLSDTAEIVSKACGRSYAPFPKGCFFTSSGGLTSFEHPLKDLKPVPWMDNSGQQCGSIFVVVEASKKVNKHTGIPRVGSDADWSNQL